MDDEQIPSPRTDLIGHLFARALFAFGVFGILSAIISFYALLPGTISSTGEISALNPYSYFLLDLTANPMLIYILLAISAVIVTGSIATLFVGREGLSVGVRPSNRVSFFRYLSIFILIELVLSLISPQISSSYANDRVLRMSLPAQNFVFIGSTVSQSIIVQFLPISALTLLYLSFSRKLSLKAFLNPDRSLKQAELPVIVLAAGIASLLTSVDIGSSILNFVSFFVMNYIYIRFGLLRSIVSGFTVSQFNIILQLNQIPLVPYIMYGFLIVWSLVGVYSFITLFSKATQERAARQSEPVPHPDEGNVQDQQPEQILPRTSREMLKLENFWMRSACPSWGNFTFSLKDDLSLECKNCHHQIDRDAVGEFNIRLIRSRNYQS